MTGEHLALACLDPGDHLRFSTEDPDHLPILEDVEVAVRDVTHTTDVRDYFDYDWMVTVEVVDRYARHPRPSGAKARHRYKLTMVQGRPTRVKRLRHGGRPDDCGRLTELEVLL